MRRVQLAVLAGVCAVIGACSFTTAGNFKECAADSDCGSNAACSQNYCLPLPSGCRRADEDGGMKRAFDEPSRIPLVAILPIRFGKPNQDEAKVQSVNAMRLAISEANDRLSPDRGYFGLFVCDTDQNDGGAEAQGVWFITNLKAPAILVSTTSPTSALATNAIRKDAGTFLISPNATAKELTTRFVDDGNVWRVAPPDSFQALVVAKLVAADFPDAGADGGVRIDILHAKTQYGDGFAGALFDALSQRGYVTKSIDYDENDANRRLAAITNVQNDAPHATVVIGQTADVLPIIERAATLPELQRARGHRWYLTDSTKDPALLTPTTLPELIGAFGTAPAQGAGAAYPLFRSGFITRYGIDPDSTKFVSHSYDAAWLVMLAAQYAEGKDPADRSKITGPRLAEGMAKLALSTGPATPLRADKWTELSSALGNGTSVNIEGSSGPLDFDLDAGFAPAPYEVWQVTDAGIRVQRLLSP